MIKGSSKAGGGFYRDGQSGKITVDPVPSLTHLLLLLLGFLEKEIKD